MTINQENQLDILIPVYNEEKNILSVLNSIKNNVKTQIRILICYDHDNDTTLPILRNNPNFSFEILFIKNRGVGIHSAITTGFDCSNAEAVLVFPADDTYNTQIIDPMFEKFKQGCDVVVASRFMKGGCMKGCPLIKSFLVRAASFSLHWFARIPTKDVTNGFRLFSRRLIHSVIIESSKGATYSIELLLKCHRLGWHIGEVPALWYERTFGKSRFQIIRWSLYYFRWYLYGFATTFLRYSPQTVKFKNQI